METFVVDSSSGVSLALITSCRLGVLAEPFSNVCVMSNVCIMGYARDELAATFSTLN